VTKFAMLTEADSGLPVAVNPDQIVLIEHYGETQDDGVGVVLTPGKFTIHTTQYPIEVRWNGSVADLVRYVAQGGRSQVREGD